MHFVINFQSKLHNRKYFFYTLPIHSTSISARYRSRVVDTAAVAVPEVQLLWVTPRSASKRLNVGTVLLRYPSSFGDARL